MSPTSRTLAHLRGLGYVAEVVEHWVPAPWAKGNRAGFRKDLADWVDVLFWGGGTVGVFGIQCCAAGGTTARLRKAAGNEKLRAWLASGNRLAVHEWAKRGPRGKRKVWTLRETPLTLDSL